MGELLECKKVVTEVPAPPVETELIVKRLQRQKKDLLRRVGESLSAPREEEGCLFGAYRGHSKTESPEETEACNWHVTSRVQLSNNVGGCPGRCSDGAERWEEVLSLSGRR